MRKIWGKDTSRYLGIVYHRDCVGHVLAKIGRQQMPWSCKAAWWAYMLAAKLQDHEDLKLRRQRSVQSSTALECQQHNCVSTVAMTQYHKNVQREAAHQAQNFSCGQQGILRCQVSTFLRHTIHTAQVALLSKGYPQVSVLPPGKNATSWSTCTISQFISGVIGHRVRYAKHDKKGST